MLIDAITTICADRAVACIPDLPDGDDLLGSAGMLKDAFFGFSKRIREELKAPTTFDTKELAEHLRLWDNPKKGLPERSGEKGTTDAPTPGGRHCFPARSHDRPSDAE
jgi:hypothetical protein